MDQFKISLALQGWYDFERKPSHYTCRNFHIFVHDSDGCSETEQNWFTKIVEHFNMQTFRDQQGNQHHLNL